MILMKFHRLKRISATAESGSMHGSWVPVYSGGAIVNRNDPPRRNRCADEVCCLLQCVEDPSLSQQGRPVPSRYSAPRRHYITACPRQTSSPILQNLVFGTRRDDSFPLVAGSSGWFGHAPFAHALAGELDSVGIVNDAIENSVGLLPRHLRAAEQACRSGRWLNLFCP